VCTLSSPVRERERERERERGREREEVGRRERKREGEREKEGGRERGRGMMGALAPFNCVVIVLVPNLYITCYLVSLNYFIPIFYG